MQVRVCKFGGSSLADAKQFEKVRDILLSDDRRRFVVPSAPGKRFSDDSKVTDMLYACQQQASEGKDFSQTLTMLCDRFKGIIAELSLSLDLTGEFETIRENLAGGASAAYAASRGEYLNGLILANYLGWAFIDAADVVSFKDNGSFDSEKTQDKLSARLETVSHAVIPGFYGSKADGEICTFSRGGSDISGAIAARAAAADLYENWTDVSGFLMADPRVVDRPKAIRVLTYRELRELSYMGATVLHEDAIFPVRRAGIPINIRNTNEPTHPGTMIVVDVSPNGPNDIVTGIAGRKGFTIITIEKAMMNAELGFGRRVLEALESEGVSFEHMPTGIDTMCVVVSDAQLQGRLGRIMAAIDASCHPDTLDVLPNLALIATVGRGMVRTPGTAARVFSALQSAGVNIRMIDQGSSELNIICGVDTEDFETAMRAIYSAFVS